MIELILRKQNVAPKNAAVPFVAIVFKYQQQLLTCLCSLEQLNEKIRASNWTIFICIRICE